MAMLRRHTFGEVHFKERLIGNITFVGERLQVGEQWSRQPQRDRGRRGLQIWKPADGGATPVDVLGRVVRFPKCTLLSLRPKRRNGLSFRLLATLLSHRSSVLGGSSDVPR